MTLYEIDAALLACIDPETGEVDLEQLESLQQEREKKIAGVLDWWKDLTATAAAIKAEIAALQERRAALERKADSLTDWLTRALDGEKFQTPRAAVSYRRSTAVAVDEPELLPPEYVREKVETVPDKVKIKEALVSGAEVPGARLESRTALVIK